MSARQELRNRVRVNATALCQWKCTPHGLRATWRPACRVTGVANDGGRCFEPAASLAHGQQVRADGTSAGSARPSVNRWISGGFIVALYLLVLFAEFAVVIRA